MLKDPRSERLISNFVGQWLQARDVETVPVSAKSILGLDSNREAARAFDEEFVELARSVYRTNDRRAALAQWELSTEEAMAYETRLGLESIASEEMAEAVGRFVSGEGRHGSGV